MCETVSFLGFSGLVHSFMPVTTLTTSSTSCDQLQLIFCQACVAATGFTSSLSIRAKLSLKFLVLGPSFLLSLVTATQPAETPSASLSEKVQCTQPSSRIAVSSSEFRGNSVSVSE